MGRFDYEDEMKRAEEHEKELQRKLNMDDGVQSRTVSGFTPNTSYNSGSNMYGGQNFAPNTFSQNPNGYQQFPGGFNNAPPAFQTASPGYMQNRNYRYVYAKATDPVKARRALNLMAAIFLILAIVLFAIMGIVLFSMHRSYERCTATTEAIVIQNVSRSSSSKKSSGTYAPVFAYVVDGHKYTKQSHMYENPARHKVGEVVELHYNPDDPEEYYVDKQDWFIITLFGVLGGVFALIGTICLAAKRKVTRRMQSMMQ